MVYKSKLSSIPPCLDYYRFIISFKIRHCESSKFVFVFVGLLVFRSVLTILVPLTFHTTIRISFSISEKKKNIGFDWSCFDSTHQIGGLDIVMTLSVSIHGHGF